MHYQDALKIEKKLLESETDAYKKGYTRASIVHFQNIIFDLKQIIGIKII